jgi:hypothetical protein
VWCTYVPHRDAHAMHMMNMRAIIFIVLYGAGQKAREPSAPSFFVETCTAETAPSSSGWRHGQARDD